MKPSTRAIGLQDDLQKKLKAHKIALSNLHTTTHITPLPIFLNDTFFTNHARYILSCELKEELENNRA